MLSSCMMHELAKGKIKKITEFYLQITLHYCLKSIKLFIFIFQMYENRLSNEVEANKQYCQNIISQTETLKMISSTFSAMFGILNFEVWQKDMLSLFNVLVDQDCTTVYERVHWGCF